MRHSKMAEWMENVEKSIARIMADKVYTSAEFKRERDTFNSLSKDLERTEVKKWLAQILEILMAERAKDQKKTENDKLDALIQKHEELIPNVQKTSVMVGLYWKCYAYGDELKPHVEFLDGIMLSSTRDIAPSCIENVDELIERQEKSLSQLDAKKSIVTDLIAKGKVILQNPDKPKFLEGNVKRVGMTPRRRHKTDFNSSMRPRMLSLAMLKTMKQLLQNLKLPRRKSRRSKKCSTSRQPMLISRRDRTFLRRAPTLSMDSLIPSMPIWLPCPSPFLRTRRKLLQRKLQLLRTSLRSMDVLPPQSRRLKILLLT